MNIHYMDFFPGHRNYIFYISHLSFHESQNKIFKIYVENEILLRLKCCYIASVWFCQKETRLSDCFHKMCMPLLFLCNSGKGKNGKKGFQKLCPSPCLQAFCLIAVVSLSFVVILEEPLKRHEQKQGQYPPVFCCYKISGEQRVN